MHVCLRVSPTPPKVNPKSKYSKPQPQTLRHPEHLRVEVRRCHRPLALSKVGDDRLGHYKGTVKILCRYYKRTITIL